MDPTTRVEPIRASVTVHAPVERAFALFTGRLSDWWPLRTHSIGEKRAERAVIEPHEGGRVYEVMAGGEEADWGRLLVWDPPVRLVIAWRVNPASPGPTEIEVRFAPTAGGTRVDLEHRGWEIFGDGAVEARGSYDEGWPKVLSGFARLAEG